MSYLFQDWNANYKNSKGQAVMLLYRFATFANYNKFIFFWFIPYLIIYRIFVEWILGIELPYKAKLGKNIKLYHAHSLVINKGSVIGNNCTLRQSTTIGNKTNMDGSISGCPIIGNDVDIGANVCIIGQIQIGNNVKIGAGSVVVKNIPDNCVIVGNPAKIIKYFNS
jgi:putative colanic acid biosynthesis acetyltransferase WcaB